MLKSSRSSIVLAVSAFIGIVLLIWFVQVYNQAVWFETTIDRSNTGTKNSLSNYTLTLQDVLQVPDMLRDDLVALADAVYQGKYGEDGTKAVMLWTSDQSIPLDQQQYREIADLMKSGRKEFQLGQDRKTELCTSYDLYLNQFGSGMLAKLGGFPKRDINRLCRLVLDKSTNRAFETFEAESIKVRPKKDE